MEAAFKGLLTINIVKAEMSIDLDSDEFMGGKMDPLCALVYNDGAYSAKTKACQEAGKKPIWNEEYVLKIESDKEINLKVSDEDLMSNELAGEYTGSVSTILGPDPKEDEYFESNLPLKMDDKLTGILTVKTKL